MADPYNLDLTAAQINTALNNAWDSDNAPSSGGANLVNSNKIHQFVTGLVGAETTAREAADTALSDRVDTLEGLPFLGEGQSAIVYKESGGVSGDLKHSTGVLDFMDSQDIGLVKDSSLGSITESGSVFTIPAGTWYLEYSFSVSGININGTTTLRVNSSAIVTGSGNSPYFIGSIVITQGSPWTLDVYWQRVDGSARLSVLPEAGLRVFHFKKLT